MWRVAAAEQWRVHAGLLFQGWRATLSGPGERPRAERSYVVREGILGACRVWQKALEKKTPLPVVLSLSQEHMQLTLFGG